MKAISYNALQLRILISIFCLFLVATLSYRVFVERPKIASSIEKLMERELTSLKYQAEQSLNSLQLIVTDYADWDSTYEFIQQPNDEYIKENFVDNTFINLKIDGVFFLSNSFKRIYSKGFNYKTKQVLDYEFIDIKKFPQNAILLAQKKNKKDDSSAFSGVISTQHGPAFFSAIATVKSDGTLASNGFVIFIRLIDADTFVHLSQATFTNIRAETYSEDQSINGIEDWLTVASIVKVEKISRRVVKDLHGKPLLLITMEHSNGTLPPLFDKKIVVFSIICVLLTYVVFTVVSHFVISPIKQLAEDIKSLEHSEKLQILTEKYRINELKNVSTQFNVLIRMVNTQSDILYQQTIRDPLTGVSNRRGFDKNLESQSQLFIRENISFSLVMIDVDHFKSYNDTLGHAEGDRALISVAQHLKKQACRINDYCARYGGEEFALLFSNITEVDLAAKLAEIVSSFSTMNLSHPSSETAPFLTVSLGACVIKANEKCVKELHPLTIIKQADKALYEAKANGRNQAIIYTYHP